MRIAVTGAAGNLGRLIIDDLINRGVDPADIVAIVRSEARAAELNTKGVTTAVAPYDDVQALTGALEDTDRLMLVSGSEINQRSVHHSNIIQAATAAGVTYIAYTSLLNASTSPLSLAPDHVATEELLATSGIPHVILRNGWYWENFASAVNTARATGHTYGAADKGKVSGAARKDYAQAAAIVITSDGHAGKVYELAGTSTSDYSQIASAIGEAIGSPVTYVDQTEDEYAATLKSTGLPTEVAEMLAGWDSAIATDTLYSTSTDLPDLLGRPTASAVQVFAS